MLFDQDFVTKWLPDNRRDRKGRPVPYINFWGRQTTENTYVAFDPVVGRDAQFAADDYDGEPDFKHRSPQRQRECAVNGLCQVCGRFTDWDQRVLLASHRSIRRMDFDGHPVPVFTEPWLDPQCAGVALTWCPALVGLKKTDKVIAVTVPNPSSVVMVQTTGWIEGPLEEMSRELQPTFYVNLAFPGATALLDFAPLEVNQ